MILEVGLTGGLASGKSTIGSMFSGLGCFVIDADHVVSELYEPGRAGHAAIVRAYGREMLRPDGTIDRQKLAQTAFASPEGAQRLNALIHPLVIEEERRRMETERERDPERDRIFVVEATLLLESGGRERYDRIVVADADPATQLERAVARGMERRDAEQRIARQMTRAERLRQADYVIDTSGSLAGTERQVRDVHGRLLADLESRRNENAPPKRGASNNKERAGD